MWTMTLPGIKLRVKGKIDNDIWMLTIVSDDGGI